MFLFVWLARCWKLRPLHVNMLWSWSDTNSWTCVITYFTVIVVRMMSGWVKTGSRQRSWMLLSRVKIHATGHLNCSEHLLVKPLMTNMSTECERNYQTFPYEWVRGWRTPSCQCISGVLPQVIWGLSDIVFIHHSTRNNVGLCGCCFQIFLRFNILDVFGLINVYSFLCALDATPIFLPLLITHNRKWKSSNDDKRIASKHVFKNYREECHLDNNY